MNKNSSGYAVLFLSAPLRLRLLYVYKGFSTISYAIVSVYCSVSWVYHLEDPGVDGRIILRWIFKNWDVGGMNWIELAQDRDEWRARVNAVMNLLVP